MTNTVTRQVNGLRRGPFTAAGPLKVASLETRQSSKLKRRSAIFLKSMSEALPGQLIHTNQS